MRSASDVLRHHAVDRSWGYITEETHAVADFDPQFQEASRRPRCREKWKEHLMIVLAPAGEQHRLRSRFQAALGETLMNDAFLKFRAASWSARLATSAMLVAVAVGCADESQETADDNDDTLGQVSIDGGAVVSTGSDAGDAGVAPDASKPDAGPAGASFCEVLTIMKARCQACHGAETAAGAPMPLVTYKDFQAQAVLTPGKKVYEVTQTRMHDARRPMPPRGVRPPAELNVVDSWVAAGAPPPAAPCP